MGNIQIFGNDLRVWQVLGGEDSLEDKMNFVQLNFVCYLLIDVYKVFLVVPCAIDRGVTLLIEMWPKAIVLIITESGFRPAHLTVKYTGLDIATNQRLVDSSSTLGFFALIIDDWYIFDS